MLGYSPIQDEEMIGTTIAHYEIVEKIGAGGMGEVYRALDKKLNRDVALKILPDIYLSDVQRMGRFQREAQLLASLNHANIASIYGVEEDEGKRALVLELVEGDDLSEVLQARTLRVEEALEYAIQIAEALESAHEKGVIHRDLKPANVKITPEGKVKVLDFGLAKALAGDGDASELNPMESPTLTAAATGIGMVLGTAAYMSPEQARGKPVDRRADIWSFGVVVFEMMARKQLYAGETISDTLASVIKDAPDWSFLPGDTPQAVADLLGRCLQKDPRRRLQSIGEARITLEDVLRPPADAGAPRTIASGMAMSSTLGASASVLGGSSAGEAAHGAKPSRRVPMAWAASLVLVALLAGLGGHLWKAAEPELSTRKFYLEAEGMQVQYPTQPALSPDGTHLAYFAESAIWIRDLSQLEPVVIPGTDSATSPFWSPDGKWLAFGTANRIYKVPAAGGTPSAICDVPFLTLDGACWGEDDIIYLAPNSGPIYAVSARGGDPKPLFEPAVGESDYHTPSAVPGGRGIFFTTHSEEGRDTIEIYTKSEGRRVILKIPGARLEYATWSARDASSSKGHLVYHRMNTNSGVWALPFDIDTLQRLGEPFILDPNGSFPSVARDGSLVYALGSGGGRNQLVTVNRAGEVIGSIGQPQPGMIWPSVSPDGTKVLVSALESDNRDVWLHDVERGTRTRMSFGNEADWKAVWMNDGKDVVYTNGSAQSNRSYLRPADGSAEPVLLVEGYHPCFLPGEDVMVFNHFDSGQGDGIFIRSLDPDGEVRTFLQTDANEAGPDLSPDGKYIVYMSNESGGNEIYLISFPSGEGKWQVSTAGGAWPCWSRTGDEILYREGVGAGARIMSVAVERSPAIQLGSPVELFSGSDANDLAMGSGMRAFDVTPDPEILVMIQYVGEGRESDTRLVYSENWFEDYHKKSE